MNNASKTMSPHGANTVNRSGGSPFSPLVHLIDDDEAVRDALSLLIGTVGLRVQPWADPQAFMQGFDLQAIGAIVLDVPMPGISGLTVLETLVSQGVRQHVKSRERTKTDRQAQERFAQLSEREREVLGLIVAGLTNKEIGRALEVSPRTVETHRANLFAKLEAESLAQLIRRFAGLVEGEC